MGLELLHLFLDIIGVSLREKHICRLECGNRKRDGLVANIRSGFHSAYYLLDFEHLKMEGKETGMGEIACSGHGREPQPT